MLHDQNETQKRVNRDSEEKKYKLQFYATIVYKKEDFLLHVSGDLDRMNVSLKPLHLV